MNQFTEAYETARSGEMSTLIVSGDAGVGKTRLLKQFLETDVVAPATVLVSGCRDYGDSPLPFGAINEALRSLAKTLDDETKAQLFNPIYAELTSLLPRLENIDHQASPTNVMGSRSQLFERILSLIEAVVARGPLVLVIEDLQWADRSTRDLLAFLIGSLINERVMLVVTYRNDELAEGSDMLRYFTQLARQDGVRRLELVPFNFDDTLLQLEDLGDGTIDASLARAIWERSQGNPFYAEELLASVGNGTPERLPVNIRDALVTRINSLGSEAQTLVRIAAAGGAEIHHQLLTKVAPVHDDVPRLAVNHQILVVQTDGTYAFRHALLREVAYSQLLPGERQSIHARYAAALEQADAPPADIAHHYFEAQLYEKAFKASIAAANASEAARGYAEAHVHYERTIALWPQITSEQRPAGLNHVKLLERAAGVSHLEGDNARAVELLQLALTQAASNDPRRNLMRIHLGTYLLALGRSKEALIEHEAVAQEMSDEPPSSTHAEALCAYAHTLLVAARNTESAQQAEDALAMARSLNARELEANALTTLGSDLVALGQPEHGVRCLRESVRIAEALGNPGEIAEGYRHLALTLSGPLNLLDEAFAVAQQGVKRVAELGLDRHWGLSLQSIAADTLFRLGRWDEAIELVNDLIRRSPKGEAALDLLLARIKLTVGRGDFELADADLAEVATLSSNAMELRYTVPLATLQVGLALWRRELARAEEAFETGLSYLDQTDDVWFAAPLVWHGMRVQAERAEKARAEFRDQELVDAIQRAEELRQLLANMCQSGRQQGALRLVVDAYDAMAEGELLRVRGVAATDTWTTVANAWTELGQPYPAAYANWRWAEALLARPNGTAKATPLLKQAYQTALSFGAVPLRRELEALARRARIELSAPEVDVTETAIVDVHETARERLIQDAGLTKREAEVLSLVADGKSNRAIAEACFISEKTASVHVSNILTKLNVQSRVQAAAVFHRATQLN